MQLGLSENLSALVARRFTAAKEGGHLIFSPTQLSNIQTLGIPVTTQHLSHHTLTRKYIRYYANYLARSLACMLQFQLRYCPALAKKPTATPKPEAGDGHPPAVTKKPDPFENPSPELLIAQIPAQNPAYNLVLNKFPVIPDHFILATREWKSQTDLLEKGDLEATYACVKTWAEVGAGKRLFAFFNSGEDSGASQPHRHIQFLPVEAMAQQEGEGEGEGKRSVWRPLIDVAVEEGGSKSKAHPEYRWSDRLPFAHFALPLPSNPSAETLHAIYLSLYRAAVAAAAAGEGKSHEHDPHQTDGEAVISHNLAMTESAMMICPRRNESASISLSKKGVDDEVAEAGVIALNGTILAGTLMVKAEAEWNELRRDPEALGSVLAAIGYPAEVVRSVSSL